MDAPKMMTDMLEELVDAELKQFNRELWNGVRPDKDPIPRGKLERVDRQDVVDFMVQYYSDDAGNVAVQALRNIKQNERAERLMLSLQKVLQPEQEEPGWAPVSAVSHEDLQPIQSDWQRANMITPSSQEFKRRLLKENGDQIYMPSKRHCKGLALLITNIKFARKENNRHGAEQDKKKMEWLLTALGYRVVIYTDLTGKGISRAVRDFSRRREHKDSDSTFVVIMSHGCRIQNKDAISGVKKSKYFVEETFTHLNSAKCPGLIDKPKVILIQACRGGKRGGVAVKDGESEEEEEGEEEDDDEEEPVQDYDPESDGWVHREKDFVCFMSSLPDISAYRSHDNGSYFINYIVDVFTKWAHKDDIMELFRKVTLRMENDQRFRTERKILPCIERTSLGRKFYLFPGQQ